MWNKQSTALESRIHSSIPGSLCVLHFVSRKPLLLYILEKRIILRYLNRNKIRGEERSNRGVKNQRQNCASAIALRLGGGGCRVEQPCTGNTWPCEHRRAVRNQSRTELLRGRQRKVACLMNLMNFRVTKLFPQRSLKQIPKESHHFSRSRERTLIKRGQASEGNTGLSKSLLFEKQTPHC